MILTFEALLGSTHYRGAIQVTDSTTSLMAIAFGVAVFAVIVAVGWRSVQNRRILRLQGADGKETIIIAGEDDDVTSLATTTEMVQPAPTAKAEGNPSFDEAKADASVQER